MRRFSTAAAPPPAAVEPEKPSLNPWAASSLHAAEKVEGSGFALPPELQLKPCEELPYESLEVLINAENVWANIQAYNVTSLGFDLTDETRWHPFIVPKVYDPPPPRPFYSTSKVAAKLPEQRLAALTATLGTKLRAEYTSWRLTRSMRMRSMIAGKSTVTSPPTFTPKSLAVRTSCTRLAQAMTALEGKQPTFRQSPPM